MKDTAQKKTGHGKRYLWLLLILAEAALLAFVFFGRIKLAEEQPESFAPAETAETADPGTRTGEPDTEPEPTPSLWTTARKRRL